MCSAPHYELEAIGCLEKFYFFINIIVHKIFVYGVFSLFSFCVWSLERESMKYELREIKD